MSAKNTPNGFYIYMQAERNRMQKLNKITLSMQDMAVMCAESWRNLSAEDKANYNELAKQEKLRLKNDPNRNKLRMDNQRQIIAKRKDPVDEDRKRRTLEVQTLMKSWEGQDILDVRFHVINFQVMYDDDPEDGYLPMEVGLACFSLREGIVRHMHHLIDPGDAPQGSRHIASKHSENTHQIPLCYEKANQNFLGLQKEIEKFVATDLQAAENLTIFSQKDQRKSVESCLEYIHYRSRAREASRLTQIYTLEDLVISLIRQSGTTNQKPSEAQIRDMLLQNRWDSNSKIRCPYHDELDCSHCSLAIVKRFCFSLFDQLSNMLEFKITAQHIPDETESSNFVVKYPKGDGNDNASHRSSRRERNSSSTSSAVSSLASSPYTASRQAWDIPRASRVEVQLSETESDSDDEGMPSNGAGSTAAVQYNLQELRKPFNPALSSRGGRGKPRCDSPVRPPPGFEPVVAASMLLSKLSWNHKDSRYNANRHGTTKTAGTMLTVMEPQRQQDFPSLFHNSLQVGPTRQAAPTTNVWGVGRSRGMLPPPLSFQRPK